MMIWYYLTGGGVSSSPAVTDGKVYVGSHDNKMYCLDAMTGMRIWDYVAGGQILSSPAIAEGNVYVGSMDNKVYCFGSENLLPVADFTWTPSTPNPGQTITFNASSSYDPDGYILLYEWDWNNDGIYDESHVSSTATYSWSNGGNYSVTLRVTDNNGATGTQTKTVKVNSGNQPPEIPSINGPAKGKVGVATEYNFTTTDPDRDQVYYFIDWGDTTNSSWVGPYPSGDLIIESHTWSKKGIYTIKAKAKDIYGNESAWTTLKVSMPLSNNIPTPSFREWLFERFPHAFPILRQLLGH
jgi:PKD repeat protein